MLVEYLNYCQTIIAGEVTNRNERAIRNGRNNFLIFGKKFVFLPAKRFELSLKNERPSKRNERPLFVGIPRNHSTKWS